MYVYNKFISLYAFYTWMIHQNVPVETSWEPRKKQGVPIVLLIL